MSDKESALPPNWRMARDSDGKAYYFNELTGETSWNFPSAPAPVAAMVTAADVEDNHAAVLSTGDVVAPHQGGTDMSVAPTSMVGVGGPGGSRGGGGGTLSDVLTAEGLPKLLLVMFASVVLLIQAWIHLAQKPGEASFAYAISVSVVSLGSTALFLIYARRKPDEVRSKTFKVRGSVYTMPQVFAFFITIWWGFGAFILTFYKPYSVLSNAYVACWLGFVCSALYSASVFSRVEDAFRSFSDVPLAPSLTALSGCIVAAAVVFLVALGYTKFWTGTFAWVTSLIEFLIACLTYFCISTKRLGPTQSKVAAAILVIMWALSIFFLTFDLDIEKADQVEEHMSAFTEGGNGLVATWAGMFCSFSFAYSEFVGIELNMQRALRRSFAIRLDSNPDI